MMRENQTPILKYRVRTTDDAPFQFEKEFDSFDSDAIAHAIWDGIRDTIDTDEFCYFDYEKFIKPNGLPDLWAIECNIGTEQTKIICHYISQYMIVESIDNAANIIHSEPLVLDITLWPLFENGYGFSREPLECFAQSIGAFLETGTWQMGLQYPDTHIETNPEKWPQPVAKGQDIFWSHPETAQQLYPVMWFGIPGERPLVEWTLGADAHAFWNYPWDRESIPWSKLLKDLYDCAHIWMFAEYDIETPEEEFATIKNKCPVDLTKTDAEIQRAISDFLVATYHGVSHA